MRKQYIQPETTVVLLMMPQTLLSASDPTNMSVSNDDLDEGDEVLSRRNSLWDEE